jgi:nitroreductase
MAHATVLDANGIFPGAGGIKEVRLERLGGGKSMALSAIEVNDLKHAPAVEGVLPAVLGRWSPRSFADRDVSAADLRRVFEAARWAASSRNEQPWRFVVGLRNSPTSAMTYLKIFSTLASSNQAWADKAPVLMLGVTSTRFAHNGAENRVALYDLGAAASYLTLEASALGLAAHQMAGFDQAEARRALEIPEDYAIGAVIALGYQGEPSALTDEQHLAQEIAPRVRKAQGEFVFSAWGVAADLG